MKVTKEGNLVLNKADIYKLINELLEELKVANSIYELNKIEGRIKQLCCMSNYIEIEDFFFETRMVLPLSAVREVELLYKEHEEKLNLLDKSFENLNSGTFQEGYIEAFKDLNIITEGEAQHYNNVLKNIEKEEDNFEINYNK